MRKRVDTNHAEIVQALRRAGAAVQSLADVGQGVPDLLVGLRGENFLLEVKQPGRRGELRVNQVEWHNAWRGQCAVVRTVDEALQAVGLLNDKGSV